MDRILDKWNGISYMRLLLALAVVVALAVIYVYAFNHPWGDLLENLIPEFAATCIAVVVAYLLLSGLSDRDQLKEELAHSTGELIQREVSRAKDEILQAVNDTGVLGKVVSPLSPRQVKDHLTATATGVTEYWFLGNSGTHFSVETLPHLGKVEAKTRDVLLRIQLLDPQNDKACRRYADDRKKQLKDVVIELYATILRILVWTRTNPRLRLVVLSVRPSLTHFRVDWSPKSCVITTEGRDDPALLLHGNYGTSNHLHVKVKDQLTDSYSGGRELRMPKSLENLLSGTTLKEAPDEVLQSCLKELAPVQCAQDGWAISVIRAAKERTNPYA